MPTFISEAREFAYLDEGRGRPILLVHGFASNRKINWLNPGWIQALTLAGRRVIAFDNRGHGDSAKFYSPEDYSLEKMAGDALALMDTLGLYQVDALGYSLGARILVTLALSAPARLNSIVLGGMGGSLIRGDQADGETIAAALEAPSVDQVSDPKGRAFRAFAEQTKSDLSALAACARGYNRATDPSTLANIQVPTLVAVGTRDYIAGPARDVADLIPGAEVFDIPNRDHMVAVGDQSFKRGVIDFLGRH